MRKLLDWYRSKQYVWHRKEYEKAFNLAYTSFVIFPILIFVIAVLTKSAAIGVIMFSILVGDFVGLATIRLVDEHEKKLAIK